MDMILLVVMFAFLVETVVEILKPLWHKLEGLGNTLGVEIAYIAAIA